MTPARRRGFHTRENGTNARLRERVRQRAPRHRGNDVVKIDYLPGSDYHRAPRYPVPYTVPRRLLLQASPFFRRMIEGDRLHVRANARTVHMFLVWAHYKVLLNPDPILCEGERLITGLPHDFVYDTIRDFYLMCLYLFARTFDIRALENDIMTQLILQHFLDDTVVDAGCVSAVDRWMDRTKNHFVEFATAQMAHLSWNNRRLRPEDDYDRTEFYILIKLFKKDEDYVKARLKGEVPYIPAENVCDFHRHRAGEQEECREKQRHLGLPVPPEDEEEDSEDE